MALHSPHVQSLFRRDISPPDLVQWHGLQSGCSVACAFCEILATEVRTHHLDAPTDSLYSHASPPPAPAQTSTSARSSVSTLRLMHGLMSAALDMCDSPTFYLWYTITPGADPESVASLLRQHPAADI